MVDYAGPLKVSPERMEEMVAEMASKTAALRADIAAMTDQSAQVLAVKVWSGQSPDLPRHERLRRIKAALEAQGLSMDGVTL